MFSHIAWFELRQQLRGHVFWVVMAISTAMVLGSIGLDQLRVGVSAAGLRNGAEAVVQTHLVWTLFFMFTTAAFVGDAVLRDDITGFAPILRTMPVTQRDYLLGRFAGSFAAVVLCFGSVPLALLVGGLLPWVSPEQVGPVQIDAFAFALLVLALPNLFLSAAVGFALATLSRSMGVALLGAIVLLIAYGLGARGEPILPPVLEPFAFAVYAEAVAPWSAAERDVRVPGLDSVLVANRLLVLALSVASLAIACLCFDRRPTTMARDSRSVEMPMEDAWTGARPRHVPIYDWRLTLAQFAARTQLEVGQIVRTPVFAALLLLGLANAAARLWAIPPQADTDSLVQALVEAFRLLPTVIVLFFAGESLWNERELRIDRLIDATPLSRANLFYPKLLALALILVSVAGSGVAAALLVAAFKPQDGPAIQDLGAWFLLTSFEWILLASLAFFLQALAPNKLAGWGYLVLFLIASLALDRLGLRDPLYRFGRYPGWPLPASLSGAEHVGSYLVLWACVAVLLTIGTCMLVRRSCHSIRS